jgi:zeta-carotene desaturase
MLKQELFPCVAAPKGLFPPEPEHYRGPKLKVAIIGAGLAGMSTAVELLDQGHEVSRFVVFSRAKCFLMQENHCFLIILLLSNHPGWAGYGLSGLQVDLYESRPFIGGKVGSFVDKQGNHIEMGLHVFFGCYSNLFRLMKKVQALVH